MQLGSWDKKLFKSSKVTLKESDNQKSVNDISPTCTTFFVKPTKHYLSNA